MDAEEIQRFSRQMFLIGKKDQLVLRAASVVVIGAGVEASGSFV
jgi:molybdopterin/thiamine biosynthesis adenylyltransferase